MQKKKVKLNHILIYDCHSIWQICGSPLAQESKPDCSHRCSSGASKIRKAVGHSRSIVVIGEVLRSGQKSAGKAHGRLFSQREHLSMAFSSSLWLSNLAA